MQIHVRGRKLVLELTFVEPIHCKLKEFPASRLVVIDKKISMSAILCKEST